MFQLLLLSISFGYGFLVGLFNHILGNKNIFKILYFLIVTLVYVGLFYFINSGEIHLYNKFLCTRKKQPNSAIYYITTFSPDFQGVFGKK